MGRGVLVYFEQTENSRKEHRVDTLTVHEVSLGLNRAETVLRKVHQGLVGRELPLESRKARTGARFLNHAEITAHLAFQIGEARKLLKRGRREEAAYLLYEVRGALRFRLDVSESELVLSAEIVVLEPR